MSNISRILRNHKLLNNIIDLDKNIKHSSNLEESIIESCDSILHLEGVEHELKTILMLEGLPTSVKNNNISMDATETFELVSEYLLINGFSTECEIENILEKSKIKKDIKVSKAKQFLKDNDIKTITSKVDIKKVISKFYVLSKDNIIDETPNFLSWIRKGVLLCLTINVSIYLTAIVFLVDSFISLKLKREETRKMINKLKQERKTMQKKLDKAKNTKNKKRLEEYVKGLDKAISDVKYYEESLYTEKEQEERYGIDNDESSNPSTDGDWDFEDDDWGSFGECVSIDNYRSDFHGKHIEAINKLIKESSRLSKSICSPICKYIDINESDMNTFSKSVDCFMNAANKISYTLCEINIGEVNEDVCHEHAANLCNSLRLVKDPHLEVNLEFSSNLIKVVSTLNKPIKEKSKLMHVDIRKEASYILALEDIVKSVSITDFNFDEVYDELDVDNIEHITNLALEHSYLINKNKLAETLKEVKIDYYKKDKSLNKYKVGTMLENCIRLLENDECDVKSFTKSNKKDVLEEYVQLYHTIQYINENKVINNLKLVQKNASNKLKKMTDKEKRASVAIDSGIDKINDNLHKAMTNKNREKVIKGSILPSASNTIKMAMAAGIVYYVSPVTSIIGVLGTLGASKALTEVERQYILDEIDIQLKIVEKKKQMAESNNDMKSLEELLKIEQKYLREQKRIKYHLRRRVA